MRAKNFACLIFLISTRTLNSSGIWNLLSKRLLSALILRDTGAGGLAWEDVVYHCGDLHVARGRPRLGVTSGVCREEWTEKGHLYIYASPLWFITGCQVQSPGLCSRTLLSTLYIMVCICESQVPNLSLPYPFTSVATTSVLSLSESVSVSLRSSFVPYFRFHI